MRDKDSSGSSLLSTEGGAPLGHGGGQGGKHRGGGQSGFSSSLWRLSWCEVTASHNLLKLQ